AVADITARARRVALRAARLLRPAGERRAGAAPPAARARAAARLGVGRLLPVQRGRLARSRPRRGRGRGRRDRRPRAALSRTQ
ncbi:MAG: hypothetical protein AVDCRST_MAG39-1434, partial [uncultured Sphingomonadaceae bacterium]